MRTLVVSLLVTVLLIAPGQAEAKKKAHRQAARVTRTTKVAKVGKVAKVAKVAKVSAPVAVAEVHPNRSVRLATLTNQETDDEIPGQHHKR